MLIFNKIKKSYLFLLVLLFSSIRLSAGVCIKNTQFYISDIQKSKIIYLKQKSMNGKFIIPYNYPLVEKFRNQYLNKNGLNYLETIMKRSVMYREFIIEELRRENLPIELLFLPVIESGFSPKAVSKSGAVGVWQFMRNSIGGYDIHINEWLDERRDPWKTSIAAVKKLKWNYSYYQDWHLALAAYNCGVGALNKAIKRAKSNNYWYLAEKGYLKRETALYVAKFLAIADILMQSKKYGIDWGQALNSKVTETIITTRSIDLILLAEKLQIEKNMLLQLNPSLRYNITPPNLKYKLRIPIQYTEQVNELLKENTILIRYYRYIVKSGDTLYALARHYGVSVKNILSYNPKVTARNLQIGQKLLIPALKQVAVYQGRRKETNLKFNGKYKIKKGDTLWSIALNHNIPVEILAEKNGITVNSILSLGQTIKVPIQE